MRILSVLFVAALAVGSAYSDCTINDAQNANLDSTFGPTTGGNALTFNDNAKSIQGTSNNYDFNTKGIAQLHGGDNIILSGTMVPKNSTVDAGRYSLRAAFAKTTAPSDVKQELQPSAYVANGGTIDPSTWQYYQIIPESSQMVGIDPQNQGITIDMKPNPSTALQVGKGANGKNLEQGASGWFLFTASQDKSVVFTSQDMEVVDININLGCSSTFNCESNVYSISKAVVDPNLTDQPNSDQALYVNQQTASFGQQTVFDLTGTSNTLSIDQSNGNLHLVGSFVAKQDANVQVNCDLTFSTFIPVNGYMEKLELKDAAYVKNGGNIDPNLWAFYTVDTSVSSCQRVNGDKIVITGDHDKMGLQFGIGASGKNGNLGLSVWLDFQDAPGSFFDINVDVTCLDNPNTGMFNFNFTISSFKSFTTITSDNTTTNNTKNYTLSIFSLPSTTTTSSSSSPITTIVYNISSSTINSTSSTSLSSSSSSSPHSSSSSQPSTNSQPSSSSPPSSSSQISSSTNNGTALPETSPPTETPTQTAPPATCPPGCVPYVQVVNVSVTETPAAGNGASNIEMSKLLVAIISLFVLAFFH